MHIARALLMATGAVAALFAAAFISHGGLRRVSVQEEASGPYEFLYRTAPQGDFAAVRRITTRMEGQLRAAGVRDLKPLDVYYPPGSAPTEIGFWVAPADVARAMATNDPPRHRTIEAQRFLVTRIPYRSPLSFLVGFWKVDPELRTYRAANGLRETWAATINDGSSILYLQPREPAL